MFIWDEDNIRWMEAAADCTGYYEELARIVEPYLMKKDKICEIGCGLGHFACAIAPIVSHVTAVDISEKAIERVKNLVEKKEITNLTPIHGDWTQFVEENGDCFDVVMLSYISALRKNWEELRKLTKGQIIAVLANGESGTGLQSALYNPIFEDTSGRDTIINVIPFLEARGISYKLIECELEHGQPLEDIEDAYNFTSRYYKEKEVDLRGYLQRSLLPQNNRYYLPKIKKSGILIIEGAC